MQAVSYSEARENLKSMIDKVVADRAPLAITRQRGERMGVDRGDAVSAALAEKCRAVAGSGARVRDQRGRGYSVSMNVSFWPTAWEDYRHWQEQDSKTIDKLHALIEECRRHPFKGTGKPEPLGGNLSGWWSRRISQEHRLVYRVTGSGAEQVLQVAQCRYHY
jgi:toxin YoeB